MSAIAWQWTDDGVMRPLRRFLAQADREFCVGEFYLLEPVEEEQQKRDRAYHASMRDAWTQLPEGIAEQFPSPKDFRYHCLRETGYCDVARLSFSSADAAMKAVPFLAKPGAVMAVDGAIVVVKTAWSQRLKGGMAKDVRLKSYKDTYDYAASLIGVSSDQLRKNFGEAA